MLVRLIESSALLARPYAPLVPTHYIIWSSTHTFWQPHLLFTSFFPWCFCNAILWHLPQLSHHRHHHHRHCHRRHFCFMQTFLFFPLYSTSLYLDFDSSYCHSAPHWLLACHPSSSSFLFHLNCLFPACDQHLLTADELQPLFLQESDP